MGAAEPATYALLFGSPVPGYQAPAEQTTGPGTRVIAALVGSGTDGVRRGRRAPAGARRPASTGKLAADVQADPAPRSGPTSPTTWSLRGVLAWAAIFGCVSFEVFGQYGPDTFSGADDLFERQLVILAETLGLRDE